jgi:hypothetical protein
VGGAGVVVCVWAGCRGGGGGGGGGEVVAVGCGGVLADVGVRGEWWCFSVPAVIVG